MTSSSSTVTLDDLEPRLTQTPTLDDHLYFPVITDQDTLPDSHANTTDNQPRQILRDRLYVGNLHPSVDESVPFATRTSKANWKRPQFLIRYTLLQVFSKFGKVTKLDFLFHKTGLLKGKPRGYAFVEYGNKDVSCFIPSPPIPPFSWLVSGHYEDTLAHPGFLSLYVCLGVARNACRQILDVMMQARVSSLQSTFAIQLHPFKAIRAMMMLMVFAISLGRSQSFDDGSWEATTRSQARCDVRAPGSSGPIQWIRNFLFVEK